MKRYYSVLAALAILMTAAAVSFSQSTDRDNPTPMSASEVTGTYGDHQRDNNRENFYSFTAGPGDLTVVMDVKRRGHDDTGRVSFELLARDGSTVLLCCEGAQSDAGGTGRDTAHVKLTRRQTVVLHVTNGSDGGGTFDARFTGAGMSFGSDGGFGNGSGGGPGHDGAGSGNGGFGNGSGGGPGRDRSNGDPVDVPQTGILHIRMKNGTVQDIDLSRIRSITVKQ